MSGDEGRAGDGGQELTPDQHERRLFKPHEKGEDCAVCMTRLNYHVTKKVYMACCGKELCIECVEETDARDPDGEAPCCFCRTPFPETQEEALARIRRRFKRDDPTASNTLGTYYLYGELDLPVQKTKACKLFLKAGMLGSSEGYCNLANCYFDGQGVKRDMQKAKHYYEKAAILGNCDARRCLGQMEIACGNPERGYKHYLLGAMAGADECLDQVKKGYKDKYVSKSDFADALRGHQETTNEMKREKTQLPINPVNPDGICQAEDIRQGALDSYQVMVAGLKRKLESGEMSQEEYDDTLRGLTIAHERVLAETTENITQWMQNL